MKALRGTPEPLAVVEDMEIARPGGPLKLRLYAAGHTSENAASRPGLVYFHGGGWVIGSLDTHDNICRMIAAQSGAVVVAVDYRLSPESKFPAAVEDACAATLWVAANAARLGIDPRRIAVGGDSAGGNMGTVVAMMCRDHGGPSLALQLLLYPATDLSSFETASHRKLAEGNFLTRSAMDWFTGHYLARPQDALDPRASPLLATNLSWLPPALLITAEFDPLRDEGEAYVKRLEEAGVPVVCTRYAGVIHGFISMAGLLSEGRRAIGQVAQALKNVRAAGLASSA